MAADVVKLQPTRVRRLYRGGAQIGALRGLSEPDAGRPEDWIGSVTEAVNVPLQAGEGLSRLADGRLLRDMIEADPESWLGRTHVTAFGSTTGVLVKLLDPAERLPVHFHPDRSFAQQTLASPVGKTEAWIVVGCRRAKGEVWLGLRESVPAEAFSRWIETQDSDAMLGLLNRVEVVPGDILYVPGGTPHAIGKGLLIVELQEPSDLAFHCEWERFGLDERSSHLGLGWRQALKGMNCAAYDARVGLPEEARSFFWADRQLEAAGQFSVLVLLEGEGTINGLEARAGDTFVVPASCTKLSVHGDLAGWRCLGPKAS